MLALPASAQSVISAKSGLISYPEGTVRLNGQPVEYSVTKFTEMKENAVLTTEEGRAEVLLTPGVVLRLGENASLKMISNRLIDTRVELIAGSAVIEADEIAKDNNITIVCKDGSVSLAKAGIYRFDTEPARLKVFKGLADVTMQGETTATPVSGGRMLMLGGEKASAEKFNAEQTDALDNWSHRRGELLAIANVSAAKSLRDTGGYYSPAAGMPCQNSWAFNQWYGLYSYMPCRGALMSPYGFRLWSPLTVMNAYYVAPVYRGGGYNNGGGFAGGAGFGYPSAAQTSSGYSGVAASAPSYGAGAGAGSSAGAGSTGGGASAAAAASSGGHGGGSGAGGHR